MTQTELSGSFENSFNVVKGGSFFRPLRPFLRDLPSDYVGTVENVKKHHGPLVHWQTLGGFLNFVLISDAEVNRALFVRHAAKLKKPRAQVQTFLFAAGESVATAEHEEWHVKRKEMNALFSRPLIEGSCPGQVKVVQDYIRDVGSGVQDALTVSRKLAAVTASRGILGRTITESEADIQIAFSKAAGDRFNKESAHIFSRPNWMLRPWRRELVRRKRDAFAIVDKTIDELRASSEPNDGLLSNYLKGDFITSTDNEIRQSLVGLLMGAQDNVTSAIGWILAFLGNDPELQDKIKQEIRHCGSRASDLQECVLLQATINETLRMRPPAPSNQPRVLVQPIKIAGHTLPKGAFILNSFFNMHHDPEAFPNPTTFDPNRFLGDRSLSSFVPFGHGPRNCVAQALARQQLAAIMFGILKEHRIVTSEGTIPAMTQLPFLTPEPFEISFQEEH